MCSIEGVDHCSHCIRAESDTGFQTVLTIILIRFYAYCPPVLCRLALGGAGPKVEPYDHWLPSSVFIIVDKLTKILVIPQNIDTTSSHRI